MAGVHPGRVLPIALDVGTNNQTLLNDPLYLGWRHQRVEGQDYYDFIDTFIQTVCGKFPNAFLHWENFGRQHARNLLDKYRPKMATFNNDVQGTGAITLALILAALHLKNECLADQRIIIFGAGSAGIGIAEYVSIVIVYFYQYMSCCILSFKLSYSLFFMLSGSLDSTIFSTTRRLIGKWCLGTDLVY
jgi:malate dehydrogenase (oxaloacetate-decarboxylating)